MTKNNDRRKHWRFGRIYEKEQAQLWNVLRKAWENFGATVLAKTVAPGKEKGSFCLVLPSSTKREIRHFDVVVVQDGEQKCTKKRNARAKLLFLLNYPSYCIFAVLVAVAVVVTEAPQDAPLQMLRSNCVWASSVKYLAYTTKYFGSSTLSSYVVPILSVLAFVPRFCSRHQFVSSNLARKFGKIRLHFRDKARLRIFSNTAAAGSCFIERMPAGTDFEAQTSFTTFQRLK